MSSTQMDLSPRVMERKQDITSWVEVDITRLDTRDKSRYQKRKSAIEEYFQTDHSVEEIALRTRLWQEDSLEDLAKSCLMLHEDGQPWGFRALVPGVAAVDRRAAVETAANERGTESGGEVAVKAGLFDLRLVETGAMADDEDWQVDTTRRQAIKRNGSAEGQVPGSDTDVTVEARVEAVERERGETNESENSVELLRQTGEPERVVAVVIAEGEPGLNEVAVSDAEMASVLVEETVRGVVTDAEKETKEETAGNAEIQAQEEVEDEIENIEVDETLPAAEEQAPSETHVAQSAASEDTSLVEQTPTETGQTLALEAAHQRNSRQLTGAWPFISPTQLPVEESHNQVTGSPAVIRRSVRKRWERQDKQQKRCWVKIISAAVIVTLLVVLLIPLCVSLVGYNAYTNIKGVATDGLTNLMAIQALIPAKKSDITSILDLQKLSDAKTNLARAQDDFLQLQDMVNRPDIQSLLHQFAPEYGNELGQARHLIQVALDATNMGQELIGVAQMGAKIVHGGALLSGDPNKPLITADDISVIEAALVHAQYYLSDIQAQMKQVDLASLPLGSPSQKAKLLKYLPQLVQAQSTITQVQSLVGPISWLLGVGQTRHFLVQTLDRGELRPSGGFAGQYGVLTLQNGRMSPFTLSDVTLIDYAENGAELGAHAPSQYKWSDFGNFGVRDANLSADYPTTAQLVMRTFQQEGGGPIDGDIQITPVIIEQLLQITGPVYLAEYHETVTAGNLETKIHLYQQDYQFINKEAQVTGKDNHQTRKAFTSQLGQMLLARIKGLSIAQLMDFSKYLFQDFKSRDLQVYFTNPVAEQWLVQNGYSGAMPALTNGVDGFMVVQSNISISKAAEFVHTTFNDQVTLDAQGGAMHDLTVTLNYDRGKNPVYGYNTYADYVRVYVPGNAQLYSSGGFDTGSVICTPTGKDPDSPNTTGTGTGTGNGTGMGNGDGTGSTDPAHDTAGSYVDNINGLTKTVYGCGNTYHSSPNTYYRYCDSGSYELGYDGMTGSPWPARNLGAASSTSSDQPGYQMWGGLTLTPMNCTTTLTFKWYTPGVVQNTPGQSPYRMIIGHQAGWPDTTRVNIDASALQGVQSLSYNQSIDDDTLVALANRPLPPAPKKQTTPTPVVTPTPKSKKQ